MTDVRHPAHLSTQAREVQPIAESSAPARVRLSRIVFAALAWFLVAAVLVQIFLAGLAVFVDGSRWETHKGFVHVFEFAPLIMLGFAFAARLPLRVHSMTVVLFVLIMLQYALAQARTSDIPELAALHVVNAAGIYYIALTLARQSISFVRHRPAV